MGRTPNSIQSDGTTRLLIGIDPGKTTGVCILRENPREICSLYALDFWSTYKLLLQSSPSLVPISQIYIEQPSQIKFFWHGKALANSPQSTQATRDKMVWNCAENAREGVLLGEGLRSLGYTVFDCRPVGRKKWTSEEFQAVTGYPDRSNQHVRDAAFLVWDKQWQSSDIISTVSFPK